MKTAMEEKFAKVVRDVFAEAQDSQNKASKEKEEIHKLISDNPMMVDIFEEELSMGEPNIVIANLLYLGFRLGRE